MNAEGLAWVRLGRTHFFNHASLYEHFFFFQSTYFILQWYLKNYLYNKGDLCEVTLTMCKL